MDWSFFCVFLVGLISGAMGGGGYHLDPYNGIALDYYSKPKYSFGYEVEDYYKALSHGRWETRDGDLTQGQYRVLLPDGRLQIVSYIANKHGYFPTVEYIGKSVHPPPPPVYAKVKVPKILQAIPIAPPIQPAIVKQPIAAYYNDPYGVYGPNYPGAVYGGGYHLDPLYAAGSDNAQVQQQQQHLLYDRTLFRRDLEDSNNPAKTKNKKKRRRVRKIRISRKTPKLAEAEVQVQPIISESEAKIFNQ